MSRASPQATMKLPELKERVREVWDCLNDWRGQVIQPENFGPEIRRFGDKRFKSTWIKALAYFESAFFYGANLDAYMLILNDFNFTPDRWDYEYRHEIFDAFLMYPNGLDLIKMGLEQLFSSDFTPEERAEANGFFGLVEERSGEPGRDCLPVGLERKLTAAHTEAKAS